MADFQHTTVMVNECLEALAPALQGRDKVFVDATVGLGGHTESIVQSFDNVRVIAIDRDQEALERSKVRLAGWNHQIDFVHADFDELEDILATRSIQGIDGILFDLGVSSMQLDDETRGFSYHQDARLDMRMDASQELSAYEVVNSYEADELEKVLFEFGEEKYAKKIVAAIVKHRPVTTTGELVDVIKGALPAFVLRKSGHPARKSFQAIRIEVNQELEQLRRVLQMAVERLNPSGRILVLTYHSLEDRIVKNLFRKLSSSPHPIDLPIQVQPPAYFLVYSGGLEPTDDEVNLNPRSRSARLRVLAAREAA